MDDRGEAVAMRSAWELTHRMGVARSKWARLADVALMYAACLGLLAWFAYDIDRNGLPAVEKALGVAAAIVVLLVVRCSIYLRARAATTSRHPKPRLRERGVATALAWGHCAACGERLRDFAPEPDGCVACPTCRAAWHADRWSHGKILERDVRRALYESNDFTGDARDARGVTLTPGAFSRHKWITPSVLGDARTSRDVPSRGDRIEGALNGMDWARSRWVVITAVACVSAVFGFLAIAKAIQPHLTLDVSVVFHMMLIWALMSALQAGNSSANRAYARAALNHGLCPNCGRVVNTCVRVEFDGCISCSDCGRAWVATDLTQPDIEPTDALPNSFAYRLGRTLSFKGRGDG